MIQERRRVRAPGPMARAAYPSFYADFDLAAEMPAPGKRMKLRQETTELNRSRLIAEFHIR